MCRRKLTWYVGRNFLALYFESILRRFYLVFRPTVPPDYTMSVFRSGFSFKFSTSLPNLIVHSQFGEQLSLFCILEMSFHNHRRNLCEILRSIVEMVLCQLPISNLCSFLLTYAWCHFRMLLNTLVLIVTFVAFCWLLSCRRSQKRLDLHSGQSIFCFVSGSLLARWRFWRTICVGKLALSLMSSADHSSSNQFFASVHWDFCWPS